MSPIRRVLYTVLALCLSWALYPVCSDAASFTWQSNQCWQTGQLSAESFACEVSGTANYLPSHMVDSLSGYAELQLATSGQYCSYKGLGPLDVPEETPSFDVPVPYAEYQEGNGYEDLCAAWTPVGEPVEWGLQLYNNPESGYQGECYGTDPKQRCSIEDYISLAGQELKDRPWASYFGVDPTLVVWEATEAITFQPGSDPGEDGGWGYVCPVVEDRTTGNILEICFEQWRSAKIGREWEFEHVAECHSAGPGFWHNYDKVIVYPEDVEEFANIWGEPVEEIHQRLGYYNLLWAERLTGLVELDNEKFVAKEAGSDPSERLDEPEPGNGCGRSSSTNPQEWALIGIANGMEEWGAGKAQTKLLGGGVWTSFTPEPPEVSAENASNITRSEATVTAEIDPNGFPTKYLVEYGGGVFHSSSEYTLEPGLVAVPVSTTLKGLAPDTTYSYRIKAFQTNEEPREDEWEKNHKITYGAWHTFTTGVPQVETTHASSITKTSALLEGSVNPEGSTVSECYFEYGTTETYGFTAPCYREPGSGEEYVGVTASVTGLREKTTYYFRLVAKNAVGESYARSYSFTTLPIEPSVTTEVARSSEATSATLQGTVNPNGESVTGCYFEYGTSRSYGLSAPCSELPGSGEGAVSVSASLSGLASYTTYHYRLVATNHAGTGFGDERTFVTSSQCMGSNVVANGAMMQGPIQAVWAPEFNTSTSSSACSGTQGSKGEPKVEYKNTATMDKGSGACLKVFGAEQSTPDREYSFCATDEPPDAKQKEEIESYKVGGEAESLETIPVLQGAVAIIVHLPEGCRASSEVSEKGKYYKRGRLALDDSTVDGIYRGTINTWKQVIEAQKEHGHDAIKCEKASEEEEEIERVVRTDHAGTTHIFKDFLSLIDDEKFEGEAYEESYDGSSTGCGKKYSAEAIGWHEVSEGCYNQRWPEAAHVSRPAQPGDEGVIDMVNDTPSSIGYADLATVREYGYFSAKEGTNKFGIKHLAGGENKKGTETKVGEQNTRFWVELRDRPTVEESEVEAYTDPSSKGDEESPSEANCADTQYIEYESFAEFPPSSTRFSWNKAMASLTDEHYPLCGLTYDLAFREYRPYLQGISEEEGRARATTTENYLKFVLEAKGGQLDVKDRDYSKLPSAIEKEAERGGKEIGYAISGELLLG